MNEQDVLNFKTNSLLIWGETGTGKTFLAKQIHQKLYSNLPFIQVDLASLTENLFESELFGHIKGAFTGAIENKPGFIDRVGRGVLFLDEIGEISLQQQLKLLRLLDEKIYYPVGSSTPKEFHGTIIMATNKNLQEMVEQKTFRKDLYYRLNTFKVLKKPLRNSPQDLLSLIPKNLQIEEGVLNKFFQYSWPGNCREFKNCLEYMMIFNRHKLELKNLPPWLKELQTSYDGSFYEALESFEKKYLEKALKQHNGKINLTSKMIGLNKVTLIKKIKQYGLKESASLGNIS